MAVKYKHSDVYSMYFCTFTCYEWMPLFEMTHSYDIVYDWFKILINKNHVHCILYFPEAGFNLNKILSNGKRFMAYEIINRLETLNDTRTIKVLQDALTKREKNKSNCIKFLEILLMPRQFSLKAFSSRN